MASTVWRRCASGLVQYLGEVTTLLYDVPTPRIPSADLETLQEELTEHSVLSRSAEVDTKTRDFIRTLPMRLRADAPSGRVTADPYLSEQLYAGVALAASGLLEDDNKAMRRAVRLALEQVRQALRDVLDGRPIDDDAPAETIVAWLEATLGASQVKLASLVGAAPRTWQRWKAGDQLPDDVAALRLRRLASIVGQLRHTLTSPGVLGWLERPHPELKGGQATPAELLDDANGYRIVLDLAARLRTMTVT